MIDADSTVEDSSLTIERTFEAPRERVFEAWTDPDQVDRWWGPDGFTIETREMDVTRGGIWRFTMVGPDGKPYPNRIEYTEVTRPERLEYTQGSPDDPGQFRVTVTLEAAEPGHTNLTMEMQFPSPEVLQAAIDFGAEEGAMQTLGKLAEHLQRADPTGGERR